MKVITDSDTGTLVLIHTLRIAIKEKIEKGCVLGIRIIDRCVQKSGG